MDKTNKEIFTEWLNSPIAFIRDMWGLVPQPIKAVYKEKVDQIVKNGSLKDIKEFHFESFIKGKHIAWEQWVILLAVERAISGRAPKRISTVSGHGIGKSATLSWLIIWGLSLHKEAQIPCTAPTKEQMHDVLWKELMIWLQRMPEAVRNTYDWSANYLRMVESPETWFARAKTARKEAPEALAGVHADWVMVVVDESSGVPEEVFKMGEGALTGENVLVIFISNGTRPEGYFYDSHHLDASQYQTLSFNSEESPLVDKDDPSGLIQTVIRKYGKESDEYRVKVQGLFPRQGVMDTSGYVPLIALEQIIVKPVKSFVNPRMGIDPAGDGDDQTKWVVRDSFAARTVASEDTSNAKTIASKTLTLLDLFPARPERVYLDNFGVGANVGMEIAVNTRGQTKINPRNWSEKADDAEKFYNKRAECYWRLREWCIAGGIIDDLEVARQIAKIKYKRNLKGQIQIMEKKLLVKEIGKSPDDADATAITFYDKDSNDIKVERPKQIYKPTSEYEGS